MWITLSKDYFLSWSIEQGPCTVDAGRDRCIDLEYVLRSSTLDERIDFCVNGLTLMQICT